MGQVLHGSAHTTQAVRRSIQRSQETVTALADRHDIDRKTVTKWRKRKRVEDAPMGPKTPRSTVPSVEEVELELTRFGGSPALCVIADGVSQPENRSGRLTCPPFMAASVVPFRIPGCRLDAAQADPSALTVDASIKARSAVCPECGQRSRRVHGLYTRAPADLPVSDRAVGLRLRVRRFRCLSEACPRKTFAEPFPDLVARHARRTDRLAASQLRTGLTTGAEPGTRLLGDLRMPTSPDTVLRLLHRHPVPEAETPRVLGLDEPPATGGGRRGAKGARGARS